MAEDEVVTDKNCVDNEVIHIHQSQVLNKGKHIVIYQDRIFGNFNDTHELQRATQGGCSTSCADPP